MVNSGSSANLLAISALNVPSGSEVITPALTFSTTVSPIVHCDLVPAFVDVDLQTFNINSNLIEEMINEKTKAIMIPDLLGNLPDWKSIKQIAEKYNLRIIEDSADTLGSVYNALIQAKSVTLSRQVFMDPMLLHALDMVACYAQIT